MIAARGGVVLGRQSSSAAGLQSDSGRRPRRRGRAERASDEPCRVLRDRCRPRAVAEEHAQRGPHGVERQSGSSGRRGPTCARRGRPGTGRRPRGRSSLPRDVGRRVATTWRTRVTCRRYWPMVCGLRPSAWQLDQESSRAAWNCMAWSAPWKERRRPGCPDAAASSSVIRPASSPSTGPSRSASSAPPRPARAGAPGASSRSSAGPSACRWPSSRRPCWR